MEFKRIKANITGIKYTPLLCKTLGIFDIELLESALSSHATFILNVSNTNNVAISWWVSAKRTRSYPYTRVYDSLGFSGRKITIIPIVKDEGIEGDRDFLQWDTISLMSLLGVYVIIGYYSNAERSSRYSNKITKQRFDINFLKEQIFSIISYQSDALHWNLEQVSNVGIITQKAIDSYGNISNILGVKMHSLITANARIAELIKGKDNFMDYSRAHAKQAQYRETKTTQPKEFVSGSKASITITNYLGGYYYFTADECEINGTDIYLIECKHSSRNSLPSLSDIKDGLLKMILFSNLKDVTVDQTTLNPKAVLRLTSNTELKVSNFSSGQIRDFTSLSNEAALNSFEIRLN